ncbi:MAG: SLC13 family permease [Pseudomonadales bacterium]|nr:SLC13 family permease [Pseudomonadales bacterium]
MDALTGSAWLTLGLCAGVIGVLVSTRLTPDLVLMGALTVLSAAGVLTPAEALGGFANEGLITVAALFVVAAGMRDSGAVDLIVQRVLGEPRHYRLALARLMLPVLAISGFLNNTPVVATMIPAVLRWSRRIGFQPSKLMIPLSYASILGGTLTLIGTSTSLVVNGQYRALTGEPGFSLFAITPVGLPVALAAFLFFVLTANRLLPDRTSPSETFANPRAFTFEVAVAENGPVVGLTIEQAGLRNLKRMFLAEIERAETILTAVGPGERLRGGDRLVFVGETDAILDVLRINGLVASSAESPVIERDVAERRLVEAVVSPACEVLGSTIRDSGFRERYGAVVLAVNRGGEPIRGNLGSIRLRAGDVLLLEARPAFLYRQRQLRDFLLVNDTGERRPAHDRAPLAWAVLVALVLAATTGLTSMLNASLLGAGAMILGRCVRPAAARRSLDLTVLVTIGASFALGTALEVTGAAAWIGDGVRALAGDRPWLLLILSYLCVSLLTELISNSAAALIMLPVVLNAAAGTNLNPEPFVITTMMAASASFSTPLGYQTNLMVFGPGGYRFGDFLRTGLAMNALCAVVTLAVVPRIYPLLPGS